jgi:hypothetical protein
VHDCPSQFVRQRSIRRPKTGTIDNADQDSHAVKTFSCDPSGAVTGNGDFICREKARSVSTMGQAVNAIRRNVTARRGSVVMEHFAHQQNLAHYRRLLAEAELATSGDEIRHSMLMRQLAEEEANGLLIANDGGPLNSPNRGN